mmetsp:Transcript_3246/g.6670  ORF Transcript_3246/g.6670 Transcript_3246/m.6670 type:complete len:726 (-) Transcript_3246:3908-6085(-)
MQKTSFQERFSLSFGLPLAILFCFGILTPVLSANVLTGTINGYDVGGNESVCTYSEVEGLPLVPVSSPGSGDLNDFSSGTEEELQSAALQAIESVDQALFAPEAGDDGSPTTIELLRRCPPGTNISVIALDLTTKPTDVNGFETTSYLMYPEVPYTFRVNFEMDTRFISGGNHTNQGLLFRFVMCELIDGGWCDPTFVTDPNSDGLKVIVNATSDPIRGFVNAQGQIVQSPWILAETTHDGTRIILQDLDVLYLVPTLTPRRLYRFVLHAALLLEVDEGTESNETLVKRIDAGTLGIPSALTVEDNPKILEMTGAMKLFLWTCIGAYDVVGFTTLGYLIHFRHHPAIQLAQGTFLMVLVAAAIVGGTFVFSFMPESDLYCAMRGPFVLLPFHLIGSILASRQWRLMVTISGAMQVGRSSDLSTSVRQKSKLSIHDKIFSKNLMERIMEFLTFIAKLNLFHCGCRRCKKEQNEARRRNPSHLRNTATASESAQLVTFLIFPQAVLLIIGGIIDPSRLELKFAVEDNVGRYFCERDLDWLGTMTSVLVAVVFILAVLLAWHGRDMPSFLNEKSAIFNTSLLFAITMFFYIVILATSRESISNPDTTVFVLCMILLGTLIFLLYSIAWPKIMRAVRNEKVVFGDVLRLNPSPRRAAANPENPTFMQPIIQGKDDPLPRSIEELVFTLQKLLTSVTEKWYVFVREFSTGCPDFLCLNQALSLLVDMGNS